MEKTRIFNLKPLVAPRRYNFYTKISKYDPKMRPEDIYKPFGLTRATFYRYAKILDYHSDEEIKNMGIRK